MKRLAYVLFGLAFLVIPACGGGDGGTGPNDGDQNGDDGNGSGSVAATISMDDVAYIDPQGRRNTEATVTIQVGETVRWTNDDNVDHTVDSGEGTGGTAGDGLPEGASTSEAMESGIIPPGGSYTNTFDTPGTWTYFCEVHPGTMYSATVIVEE